MLRCAVPRRQVVVAEVTKPDCKLLAPPEDGAPEGGTVGHHLITVLENAVRGGPAPVHGGLL
jgi:hypothetical protein